MNGLAHPQSVIQSFILCVAINISDVTNMVDYILSHSSQAKDSRNAHFIHIHASFCISTHFFSSIFPFPDYFT